MEVEYEITQEIVVPEKKINQKVPLELMRSRKKKELPWELVRSRKKLIRDFMKKHPRGLVASKNKQKMTPDLVQSNKEIPCELMQSKKTKETPPELEVLKDMNVDMDELSK